MAEQNNKKPFLEKLKAFFPAYYKRINLPFYFSMIALALSLFLLDYFSKHWAYYALQGGKKMTFIPGFIDFMLVGNTGAAWGSMSGQSWLLVTISLLASLALLFYLLFRFDKYNAWIKVGATLMLPGAVGNLVDRIGYWAKAGVYKNGVIDFLHFTFWPSFPVCNVADYCLTVGIVVLLIGLVIEMTKENRKSKEGRKEAEAEKAANTPSPEAEKKEEAKEEDEMKKKLEQMEEKNFVLPEDKKEDPSKKE